MRYGYHPSEPTERFFPGTGARAHRKHLLTIDRQPRRFCLLFRCHGGRGTFSPQQSRFACATRGIMAHAIVYVLVKYPKNSSPRRRSVVSLTAGRSGGFVAVLSRRSFVESGSGRVPRAVLSWVSGRSAMLAPFGEPVAVEGDKGGRRDHNRSRGGGKKRTGKELNFRRFCWRGRLDGMLSWKDSLPRRGMGT